MIVVAEADFGHAHRIVLVDDRQTAPLEQRDDGVAGVEVARPAVEIAGRQQQLRRRNAVLGQAIFVGAHQEGLTDGGARLELAQVGRTLAEVEPAHAGSDGAGTDQDDFAAGGAEALNLIRQRLHAGRLQGAVAAGQHVGADFDHDGMSQGDDFLPNRIEHEASR